MSSILSKSEKRWRLLTPSCCEIRGRKAVTLTQCNSLINVFVIPIQGFEDQIHHGKRIIIILKLLSLGHLK